MTDAELAARIPAEATTVKQLIESGLLIELNMCEASLRNRLNRMAAAGIIKRVKMPKARRPVHGKQFGQTQPTWGYKNDRTY